MLLAVGREVCEVHISHAVFIEIERNTEQRRLAKRADAGVGDAGLVVDGAETVARWNDALRQARGQALVNGSTEACEAGKIVVELIARADFTVHGFFHIGFAAREEVAVADGEVLTLAVFTLDADKAAVGVDAIAQAHDIFLAAALLGEGCAGIDFKTIEIALENQVGNTGNGIGSVNGGRAVKQQVELVHECDRDGVDGGNARRAFHAGRRKSAAVNGHERALRAEAAEVDGLGTGAVVEHEAAK